MPKVHTYLAAPKTCDKEDMIDMEEIGIVNGFDDVNECALEDIFSQSTTAKFVS